MSVFGDHYFLLAHRVRRRNDVTYSKNMKIIIRVILQSELDIGESPCLNSELWSWDRDGLWWWGEVVEWKSLSDQPSSPTHRNNLSHPRSQLIAGMDQSDGEQQHHHLPVSVSQPVHLRQSPWGPDWPLEVFIAFTYAIKTLRKARNALSGRL